jgi:hypothetical protein
MAYASVTIWATFTVAVGIMLVGTALGYMENSPLGRVIGSLVLIVLMTLGGWATWYSYNWVRAGRRGVRFVPTDGFSRLMAWMGWVKYRPAQNGKEEGDRSGRASQ